MTPEAVDDGFRLACTANRARVGQPAQTGRAAVVQWRRRHDDFPSPVGGSTESPVFSARPSELAPRPRPAPPLHRPQGSVQLLWRTLLNTAAPSEVPEGAREAMAAAIGG
ncbi:hypothetical protein GCM10010381_68030 [Streptomyces xantholiticus]|nr:hypothetical protein GCM10010381_68030 [Streptomyces xantholiticus]